MSDHKCAFGHWHYGTTRYGMPFRIYVPCGKCVECRKRLSKDWIFRVQKECKHNYHGEGLFVTLTYSDDYCPRNSYGHPNLEHKDLQNFMNRLRTYSNRLGLVNYGNIRFFATGDYGPNGTERCHWHIILFGLPLSKYEARHFIETVWQFGSINVQSLTQERIAYTCNYSCSCCVVPVGCNPIKRYMSRRPGLGSCWLDTDSARQYFDNDIRCVTRSFINKAGQRISYRFSLPRYLKDRLYGHLSDSPLMFSQWARTTNRDYESYLSNCGDLIRLRYSRYKQECRRLYDDCQGHSREKLGLVRHGKAVPFCTFLLRSIPRRYRKSFMCYLSSGYSPLFDFGKFSDFDRSRFFTLSDQERLSISRLDRIYSDVINGVFSYDTSI